MSFEDLNTQAIESNQIDLLDNGVTWSTKRGLTIKKFYFIFCYSSNEIGTDYSTKIIIPSDLDRGKAYMVETINKERPIDKEIVAGDSFNLVYSFNNIVYNKEDYKLNLKQNGCGIQEENIADLDKIYTGTIQILFNSITRECNFNYSLELKVSNEKYFIESKTPNVKPTNPVIIYNLNVLDYIIPYFINSADKNKTLIITKPLIGEENKNITEILITYSDLNVQSDKTIELNCQAKGRPKPLVHWIKDGLHLNTTEEKYKYDETGSLKILRTHPVDSGKYECNVSNRYGFVKRSFNVDVESPIKEINELSRKQVVLIVIIAVASFVLFILLIFALTFIVHQKRENSRLKVILIVYKLNY